MREFNTFDVLSHELKAKKGQNGHPDPMPEILHKREDSLDIRSLLSGEMTLAVRTSTGEPAVLKVPYSILAILMTMFIACVGAGFWLVSSITEMRTNLITIQQNQRDEKARRESDVNLMIAYQNNETNRVQFLTGMLTEDQQRKLYEYNLAHPRPPLPNATKPERER